jgi:hypothetical protein
MQQQMDTELSQHPNGRRRAQQWLNAVRDGHLYNLDALKGSSFAPRTIDVELPVPNSAGFTTMAVPATDAVAKTAEAVRRAEIPGVSRQLVEALSAFIREHHLAVKPQELTKSRHNAHGTRGAFVRKGSRDHREAETRRWQAKTRGMNPNVPVVRKKRPRPGMLPTEAGNPLGSPMQESSMQVLGAITASKRRSAQPNADWGFDPLANLPGNTAQKKPVGTPNIFMYKSDPAIQRALHDYRALLEAGKSAATATHLLSQQYPWVQDFDTPRGRDWWAAVRRADLAMPRAFEGLDTEVDPDDENGPRPKRAVFWKENIANLGQGIASQTGSGGAGR